jgi:hypothetical protein
VKLASPFLGGGSRFDSWRWDHHAVSEERRATINQWGGATSQKYGDINCTAAKASWSYGLTVRCMPNLVVSLTTWPLYAPPPREDIPPRYLLTTSLGGLQSPSEGFVEEKIPCPCWDSNPSSFVVQPEHVWTPRFVLCRIDDCLLSAVSHWRLKPQAFFVPYDFYAQTRSQPTRIRAVLNMFRSDQPHCRLCFPSIQRVATKCQVVPSASESLRGLASLSLIIYINFLFAFLKSCFL